MPAAITITQNERQWIKEYLQETYDIVINDAFDCQTLSEVILKEKGIKISYSTFRRLFDLVKNTNSQSRFVLNALAVAVGFKNWEAFKHHVSYFDTNVINQNIQIYSYQLPNSHNLILDTAKKLPLTTWLGAYQMQNIISLAIENNDFELLKKLVHLPFDIENQNVYEHVMIGFQSFYFQSVKNNLAVIEFVRTNIGTSILLQKCLLQAYVDEKYLDSFLGKWFDNIKENTLPDLLLFKNLLMLQKAFISGRESKPILDKFYSLIQSQISKTSIVIHPILKARIGVWELVLNNNEKILLSYFQSIDNPFEKADFAVIASRLLWSFYDKKIPISFLEQISLQEFPTVKDFFQKGRYNILLLTFAIHHYLKNDIINSKKYFNLYDSTSLGYDIVNVEFYEKWVVFLNNEF